MPTGSWIVRLLEKIGSDRHTVKVTRLTRNGLVICPHLGRSMLQRSSFERETHASRHSPGASDRRVRLGVVEAIQQSSSHGNTKASGRRGFEVRKSNAVLDRDRHAVFDDWHLGRDYCVDHVR
jgi:hypothetical protein